MPKPRLIVSVILASVKMAVTLMILVVVAFVFGWLLEGQRFHYIIWTLSVLLIVYSFISLVQLTHRCRLEKYREPPKEGK